MGTELPTKVMLGQTLVLMQMTFLNNLRKVGRLLLSRTSCFPRTHSYDQGVHTEYGCMQLVSRGQWTFNSHE
jgi:hypothetical protein